MFINNWYAACIATELADAPLRVTMLGCDLVLFRDAAGSPHCLSDVCSHRGAALSAGQLRDGVLNCPQHGWAYNAQWPLYIHPVRHR
ncbi:MAG: Rieske 2Fe-2S domain-containing protein [Gammaproteobacteria bacterium]